MQDYRPGSVITAVIRLGACYLYRRFIDKSLRANGRCECRSDASTSPSRICTWRAQRFSLVYAVYVYARHDCVRIHRVNCDCNANRAADPADLVHGRRNRRDDPRPKEGGNRSRMTTWMYATQRPKLIDPSCIVNMSLGNHTHRSCTKHGEP